MFRRLPIAFLATAATLQLSGCDEAAPDPERLREWTPADHGEVSESSETRTAPTGTDTEPRSPEEQRIRAASMLYQMSCAGCHGESGHGDGAGLPGGASVPDFATSEWQGSRSNEEIATIIRDGRNLMPAFGTRLRPDGIAALVEHVRRLSPPEP